MTEDKRLYLKGRLYKQRNQFLHVQEDWLINDIENFTF
jgi:hypothetical protein